MRGLCLIFHNRSFDKATGLIERDGDEFDFVNLSELFTNLGFKVEDFLNLTAEVILFRLSITILFSIGLFVLI